MNGIKATIIFCLTLLILFSGYLGFLHLQSHYIVVGNALEKGIYVVDQKNDVILYCNADQNCTVLTVNDTTLKSKANASSQNTPAKTTTQKKQSPKPEVKAVQKNTSSPPPAQSASPQEYESAEGDEEQKTE